MKNLIILITFIILLFLPVILYTKLICDFEELENEFAAERIVKDQKIEQLEKQIRILKTDIDIIQYGFNEDQNAKQN